MTDRTHDQLRTLCERWPSLARRVREIADLEVGLLPRASQIWSEVLKYEICSRVLTDSNRYAPLLAKYCKGGAAGYTSDGQWIKYIVRLNCVIESVGGKPVTNLNWLVENKGIAYYAMNLRRAINVLAGTCSWRKPRPHVQGPKSRWETGDSWKVTESVCLHNRFAVLAHECLGTDVNSVDDWADTISVYKPDDYNKVITSASKKPSPDVFREHLNKFKIKCGKPPMKDVAIISQERYDVIDKQIKLNDHAVLLNKRMYDSGYLILRRHGIYTDVYHTTLVRRYYAIERWYREWIILGGPRLEALATMPEFMAEPLFDPLKV